MRSIRHNITKHKTPYVVIVNIMAIGDVVRIPDYTGFGVGRTKPYTFRHSQKHQDRSKYTGSGVLK